MNRVSIAALPRMIAKICSRAISEFLVLILLAMTSLSIASPSALLVATTANEPWKVTTLTAGAQTNFDAAVLRIDHAAERQTIDGFGGCFNEKGWEVLGWLDTTTRSAVLTSLFDREHGCAFNLGRLPMGANDYSLDWYSYDETPEDLDLAHFSIARDRVYLIPYLRAALALNKDLRFWASPWCPPAWMKTNRHYAGLPAPLNDLRPEQAGQEMVTQFRMEPAILGCYARYFGRFIDAYAAEGVPILAVHVQNEPNSSQNFPSCVWRPEDLATFIGGYLGPRFMAEHRSTEIWLGTIERPQVERVSAVIDSPAGNFIAGVGFQWAGRDAIPEVHARYPALRLMQTETECGNGANDWAAAEHTWALMRHYFEHGAGSYMYWNIVLDETGNSRWGWRQNAMITVDHSTRTVRYNPEFFLMKHFSAFVRRGARFLALERGSSGESALVFRNPDREIVVILANAADHEHSLVVESNGCRWSASLAARSFATIVLSGQRPTGDPDEGRHPIAGSISR